MKVNEREAGRRVGDTQDLAVSLPHQQPDLFGPPRAWPSPVFLTLAA